MSEEDSRLYLSDDEFLKIVEVIDAPSVELKMDIGDEMYRMVAEYGLRHVESDDYFKIGFYKLLAKSLLKPLQDDEGQLYFQFD